MAVAEAWAFFDAALDGTSLDRQSFDRAAADLASDRESFDAFVANTAIFLYCRDKISGRDLADLGNISFDSSFHLSYRQGLNIAAQHGYYNVEQLRNWVDRAKPNSGVVMALLAQVGQLGQALTEARVRGYPDGFAEIDSLAEARIERLIESALAISEGRDADASPSTLCLIGVLRGLSSDREAMIAFRNNRSIRLDNKRIAESFARPVALPWPLPRGYYPYPALDQGRFSFAGGMVAYQDEDRDTSGAPFSYVSLEGSPEEIRHSAAHESIHTASSLPALGLASADHRGTGLALEEAACDFFASRITGKVLKKPAYYDYQLALGEIATAAGVPPSHLAKRLLASKKDNCQIIQELAVDDSSLSPLAKDWARSCRS